MTTRSVNELTALVKDDNLVTFVVKRAYNNGKDTIPNGYTSVRLGDYLEKKYGFTWQETREFKSFWVTTVEEYPSHVGLADLTEEGKILLLTEIEVNDKEIIRSTKFYNDTITSLQELYAPLENGSEKQIEWAEKIRDSYVSEFSLHYFYQTHNEADMRVYYYDVLLKAGKTIFKQKTAKFWIDNRDTMNQQLSKLAEKYHNES